MRTFVPNPTSGPRLLTGLVPDTMVLDVQVEPEVVLLTVTPSSRTAACPRCATESARIHSYYIRQPQDLPISGRATRLVVRARRFRCVNPACSTVTFAERLPNLVAVAAQRTLRLNVALRNLALAFGGEAGARQSERSAMRASGDTLLRRAHAAVPPTRSTPRVLGIDDFSFRKGQVFGTMLTDGESHQVAAKAIDQECAQQTASAAEEMQPLPQPLPLPQSTTARAEQESPARQRRLARYQDVLAFAADGLGPKASAQRVGLTRQTVAIWLRAPRFPERPPSAARRMLMSPYEPYLRERWQAGEHNSRQLWREIQAQGFRGGSETVRRLTVHWHTERSRSGPPPKRQASKPSRRDPPAPATRHYHHDRRAGCYSSLKASSSQNNDSISSTSG